MLEYSFAAAATLLIGLLVGYQWGRADGLDEQLDLGDEEDDE